MQPQKQDPPDWQEGRLDTKKGKNDKETVNFSKNDKNCETFAIEQMEYYDENDEEIIKFLNENEEIHMDFDFLPELVNVESSLISETTEPSPNFETNIEQQKLWERQINELSSIIANYDPTKPAPPLFKVCFWGG